MGITLHVYQQTEEISPGCEHDAKQRGVEGLGQVRAYYGARYTVEYMCISILAVTIRQLQLLLIPLSLATSEWFITARK